MRTWGKDGRDLVDERVERSAWRRNNTRWWCILSLLSVKAALWCIASLDQRQFCKCGQPGVSAYRLFVAVINTLYWNCQRMLSHINWPWRSAAAGKQLTSVPVRWAQWDSPGIWCQYCDCCFFLLFFFFKQRKKIRVLINIGHLWKNNLYLVS